MGKLKETEHFTLNFKVVSLSLKVCNESRFMGVQYREVPLYPQVLVN